jgi:hypothetical protein
MIKIKELWDKIKWFIFRGRFSAKFSNEDRMNITDPDWRDDVTRERSYGTIAKRLFIVGLIALFLITVASYINNESKRMNVSSLVVVEKMFHHIFPHAPDETGIDLVK